MSELDTSAEAVERLRYGCENYNGDWLINNSGLIAATLRALVVERSNARDEAAGWAGVAAGKDDVIRRLATVLSNLLTVTPAFPARNRQIVGMEDRYNKAIKEAKEVLGL